MSTGWNWPPGIWPTKTYCSGPEIRRRRAAAGGEAVSLGAWGVVPPEAARGVLWIPSPLGQVSAHFLELRGAIYTLRRGCRLVAAGRSPPSFSFL